MALKTSDVVEDRATAPTYADIDICQDLLEQLAVLVEVGPDVRH
jgi:hypothetical protein